MLKSSLPPYLHSGPEDHVEGEEEAVLLQGLQLLGGDVHRPQLLYNVCHVTIMLIHGILSPCNGILRGDGDFCASNSFKR